MENLGGAPQGLGKKAFQAPSAEEELKALTYLVEMMDTPGWKAWISLIEGELRLMENWSWRVGGPPPKMMEQHQLVGKLMSELGANWPESDEEMFKLWGRFRAVVNYWRSKLAWLQSRVDRVAELKRVLREREALRREKEEVKK